MRSAALLALAWLAVSPAGDGAVVVLVNESVPESVSIGEYYAKRRGIPADRICRIRTVADEACSWAECRTNILGPLKTFLGSRPDVLYVVPVYGVPVKTTEENAADDAQGAEGPMQFVAGRDYACIDREIELLKVDHELPGWLPSKTFKEDRPLTTEDGIYIVSRLDGPSPEAARGLVDLALYGEAYGIEGTCLLDTRGLPATDGYGGIDVEMKNIAQVYEKNGLAFTHDDQPDVVDLATRTGQAHYWGWYTGHVICSRDEWRFARGAVGAHLHSFSAAELRRKDRTWTGPLVHHGIAGTCGTVYEPLASGFPYGTIFLDRFFKGRNFGESMQMANMFTSWMAVFVGDPLYAPYAPGMKERQERNRNLAREAYKSIAAALDGGEPAKAEAAAKEVDAIGVPYAGAEDCSFLIRETRARAAFPDRKAAGKVADLRKAVDAARAAMESGDPKKGLAEAKRALDLSPVNVDANLILARCSIGSGGARAALDALEIVEKVEPGFEPLALRGRALRALNRPKEALAAFEAALALRFDIDCTREIGGILLDQKKYAEAIQRLEGAYRIRPADREIAGDLGRAHIAVKDWKRAVEVLGNAVQDLPRAWSDLKEFTSCNELLLAALKGEGRDKERIAALSGQVRDLKSGRVKPTPRSQAAAVDDRVDEAMGDPSGVALGELPFFGETTDGLPRIRLSNASPAEITFLVSGPVSFTRTLKGSAKGNDKGVELDIVPGVYRIAAVILHQGKRSLHRREQRIDVGRFPAFSFDAAFKLALPAK